MATIFAPISFPPCPVLAFKEQHDGKSFPTHSENKPEVTGQMDQQRVLIPLKINSSLIICSEDFFRVYGKIEISFC